MHHLLLHVTRVVGVICGVTGTYIIAPGAFAELMRSTFQWLRGSGARARRVAVRALSGARNALPPWLGKLLPRRQHKRTVVDGSGSGEASADASVTRGFEVWEPDAPLERKIEVLRSNLQNTRAWLQGLEGQVADTQTKFHAAIAHEGKRVDDLLDEIRLASRRQLSLNARGLPVVAIGIVLTGVPDAIASICHQAGWIVVVLAGVLTSIAGLHAWRSHRSETRVPASAAKEC